MQFGTDGIRGRANTELTCEFALKFGRAVAANFNQSPILVGRDNRISSDMLFSAVAAGLCSNGSTVIDLGVVPTPAVAYLASQLSLPAIVISASHNPFYDNGFKVIGADGIKADQRVEQRIQELIDDEVSYSEDNDSHFEVGKIEDGIDQISIWEFMLYTRIGTSTDTYSKDFTVIVDCANGATSGFAPKILEKLPIKVVPIFTEQNGYSINAGCGATDTKALAKAVIETKSDLGIAFDGDGDRIVLVDENGVTIDGDHILALYANALTESDSLKNNGVVVTSMTNLGFNLAMADMGVEVKRCDVGDRNVVETMVLNDYILGGEQSGHIIRKDITCTGDGILNAILILNILRASNEKPSEIFTQLMQTFPQKLLNIRLTDNQYLKAHEIVTDGDLNKLVDSITETEAGAFRAVIRPSGTEKLLRIMVEAKSDELVETYLAKIGDKVASIMENIGN